MDIKMDDIKMDDLFTYPEGWKEILKDLDFLPDDEAVRSEFLKSFMTLCFMIW